MTLTIKVDAKTERTLEEKARERGVSVEALLREIVKSSVRNETTIATSAAEAIRKAAIANARGMLANSGRTVDDFLAERLAEAEYEIEYSNRDFSKPAEGRA